MQRNLQSELSNYLDLSLPNKRLPADSELRGRPWEGDKYDRCHKRMHGSHWKKTSPAYLWKYGTSHKMFKTFLEYLWGGDRVRGAANPSVQSEGPISRRDWDLYIPQALESLRVEDWCSSSIMWIQDLGVLCTFVWDRISCFVQACAVFTLEEKIFIQQRSIVCSQSRDMPWIDMLLEINV